MSSLAKIEIAHSIDLIKYEYLENSESDKRREYSQFFTSPEIASFMASMYEVDNNGKNIRILDPGAGIGILSAAAIERIIDLNNNLESIEIVVIEKDSSLIEYLTKTMINCFEKCKAKNIELIYTIINEDFIDLGYNEIAEKTLYHDDSKKSIGRFDLVITNPPYKKIHSDSRYKKVLNKLAIPSTNLYTVFLFISGKLLNNEGVLIAITPRSFCNGTYFNTFRKLFFRGLNIHKIHTYNKRNSAFSTDSVLQENIILSVSPEEKQTVEITSNEGPKDITFKVFNVEQDKVIFPNDKNKIIHIVSDDNSLKILDRISSLPYRLNDLAIQVSTGRVVDYRAEKLIVNPDTPNSLPLYYPFHFKDGVTQHPNNNSKKKKEAIVNNDKSEDLLIPNGFYVFCKRFSPKEDKKRISAAIHIPDYKATNLIGIENHLNYFHQNNSSLEPELAFGLTIYLNSSIVDQYFRMFNGHTQVNADDLRYLPYPSYEQLKLLGKHFKESLPDQEEIDNIIERELFEMTKEKNPLLVNKKIEEAKEILKSLGLPSAQQNERSALILLALLNLKPNQKWKEAQSPMLSITPIMNFISYNYGKDYAPNTRETIRKHSVHQFVDAGILIPNPDEPRPVNSPNYIYQVETNFLELVKNYKARQWKSKLNKYLETIVSLSSKYAQERELNKIPIRTGRGKTLKLTPGGQNILIKKIMEDFIPYFIPNGKLLYLGDTGQKFAFEDKTGLKQIGIEFEDIHGKIPDIIVYFEEENWLVLVEAVTSHGPIDPKRKKELEKLFNNSSAGLVFITAFLDRKTMKEYLSEIAWETDIWVAESPTHLIHLDGKRFLGPYAK